MNKLSLEDYKSVGRFYEEELVEVQKMLNNLNYIRYIYFLVYQESNFLKNKQRLVYKKYIKELKNLQEYADSIMLEYKLKMQMLTKIHQMTQSNSEKILDERLNNFTDYFHKVKDRIDKDFSEAGLKKSLLDRNYQKRYVDTENLVAYVNLFNIIFDPNFKEFVLGPLSSFPDDYEKLPIENLVVGNFFDDINRYPNSLKKMNVNNYEGRFVQFPKTSDFTTLVLNNYKYDITNLPPNLKIFEISGYNKKLLQLSDSILELNISDLDGQLPNLPKNLQKLSISSYTGYIPELPQTLQEFRIEYFSGHIPDMPQGCLLFECRYFQGSVGTLSPILQTVIIYDVHGKIPPLPNTVRYFMLNGVEQNVNTAIFQTQEAIITQYKVTYGINFNQQKGQFILNRNTIEIKEMENLYIDKLLITDYSFNITQLPKNLNDLEINNYKSKIESLPEKIQRLRVYNYEIDLPPLPAPIMYLEFVSYKGNIPLLTDRIRDLRIQNCSSMIPRLPISKYEGETPTETEYFMNQMFDTKLKTVPIKTLRLVVKLLRKFQRYQESDVVKILQDMTYRQLRNYGLILLQGFFFSSPYLSWILAYNDIKEFINKLSKLSSVRRMLEAIPGFEKFKDVVAPKIDDKTLLGKIQSKFFSTKDGWFTGVLRYDWMYEWGISAIDTFLQVASLTNPIIYYFLKIGRYAEFARSCLYMFETHFLNSSKKAVDFVVTMVNATMNYLHVIPYGYIEYYVRTKSEELNYYDGIFLQIPNSVEIIMIQDYKQSIKRLPNRVEEIYMTRYSNEIPIFPMSLRKLYVDQNNYPLNPFPSKLRTLQILNYGYQIPSFPKYLVTLQIQNYTAEIPRFPKNLVILYAFSCSKTLPELPESLIKLGIYNIKDKEMVLPSGLQELHVEACPNLTFYFLPPSLKTYKLDGKTVDKFARKKHTIYDDERLLREFLVHYNVNYDPNQSVYIFHSKSFATPPDYFSKFPIKNLLVTAYPGIFFNLPEMLKELSIVEYNFDLPALPKSLERLNIHIYSRALPRLPQSIKYLSISEFIGILPGSLIDNLEEFVCVNYDNHIPILPTNLKKITIKNYQKKMPVFPESIREIYLDNVSDITENFPINLQVLHLSNYYGPIPTLPNYIYDLSFNNVSDEIPTFPSDALFISITQYKKNLPNFPTKLKKIYLDTYTGYVPPFPISLIELYVTNCPTKLPEIPKYVASYILDGNVIV